MDHYYYYCQHHHEFIITVTLMKQSLAHSACACKLPDIVLLMLLLDGLAAAAAY
jgi:hypothetical protein